MTPPFSGATVEDMEKKPIAAELAPRCDVDRGGPTPETQALGEAFVAALVLRDFGGLRAFLADDVRLRLLVPKGPQEETGAAAVAERLRAWFADADPVQLVFWGSEVVADRLAVGYRFRLRKPEGWRLVEQRLVADVDQAGRLSAIDLLCTGFRPLPEPTGSAARVLDADDLGCADGLAGEFRRAIDAVPVGEVLLVSARDPAAKEDLLPLARMLGHVVQSIEPGKDGRVLIAVERGR